MSKLIDDIPGRGAVPRKAATVAQIAERLPHLVRIKRAADDLKFITELVMQPGTEFRVFCRLEALSLSMLVTGIAGLRADNGVRIPPRPENQEGD